MSHAARAIIIENDHLLVMHRDKSGSQYFTLVGGRVNEGESIEQALVREVKEETGLTVTSARMVFYEKHPAPYNEQSIYLCEVAPHQNIEIDNLSDEALLNKQGVNLHKPLWVHKKAFGRIAFRTPQLQLAIEKALNKGFPTKPEQL